MYSIVNINRCSKSDSLIYYEKLYSIYNLKSLLVVIVGGFEPHLKMKYCDLKIAYMIQFILR